MYFIIPPLWQQLLSRKKQSAENDAQQRSYPPVSDIEGADTFVNQNDFWIIDNYSKY